jgi:histidine triad (HIT) family protein
MKPECLFCDIVAGNVPSQKVYENEHVFAFLDIHPINRGHTLVVPKVHAENIHEMSVQDFCALMETVRELSPRIKNAVGADAVNIGINNGKAAGQIIFHAHVHIIPRFEGDGHAHWHGNPYQDGEISTIRDIISQEFK